MFVLFAEEHPTRTPKGWAELLPWFRNPRYPSCMLVGWKEPFPGAAYQNVRASYVCRFDANLRDDEPRCWDRAPHRPNHIFPFLNGPRRNVLLAGGEVTTWSERRFQELGLRGKETALPD